MPKSKPPYPEAFKQQIVELAMAGRTPSELAREFGISAQSVTAWVTRKAADAGKPIRGKDVLNGAELEELARLQRRVRQDYATTGTDNAAQIMACHTPVQLPVLSALAKSYAVSDAWFCSAPCQTPSRPASPPTARRSSMARWPWPFLGRPTTLT
jgi:transposase